MADADVVPIGRCDPSRGTARTPNRRREPLLRDVVGALLRRERTAQGRTLSDVATAAQVSKPYLSEVERGRKEASSEVLGAICRSLGIGLVDLVGQAHRELTVPATQPLPSRPLATQPPTHGAGPVQLLAA